RAARAGAAAALGRFGSALEAADKGTGGDPVSAADREAEAAAVGLLRAARPGDGLLGEEGATAEAAPGGRRWVVDGIDGTQNFLAGVPHWCCAVGLEDAGAAIAGAVCDPLRDELFAAAADGGCPL